MFFFFLRHYVFIYFAMYLFSTWTSADCVISFQTGTLLWTMWSWTSRKCWNWERRRQTAPKSSAIQWMWTRWPLETSKFPDSSFTLQVESFSHLFLSSAEPQITTSCHQKAVSIPPTVVTAIQKHVIKLCSGLNV